MFATRRMLEPDNDQGPLVSWFKAKMHDIDRIFMPMFSAQSREWNALISELLYRVAKAEK
jgi:hypothetical protein